MRKSPIKGKICVSKPGEKKYISREDLDKYLDDGYTRGDVNDKQKAQKKKWFNNGKENIIVKDGEEIPDGFTPGQYQKRPGGFSKFNYRWYTNGAEQKRIKEGDPIPDGWYIGQAEYHKEKNRQAQLNKRNYHLVNKPYSDEYKELYHDLDKLKEFVDNNKDMSLSEMASRFNCPIGSVYALLNTYDLQNKFTWYRKSSQPELQVLEYIKEVYHGRIVENDRSQISPKELDIYIPDKKLAIEFNGVYYHSTNMGTPKNYHLEKTIECHSAGIKLIHIHEWEWTYKQDICKSILSIALGICKNKIYARNCEVKEVDSELAKQFLENNHIQGSLNSSYRLGLFYNNELVQLITIGKSRFKEGEYELLRMCTKLNTQVVGGFSKLMKNQPYNSLISYVDRSKFTGNGYLACGWTIDSYTSPSYAYYKGEVKLNRIAAQKHKLKALLGDENFDSSKTEFENMKNCAWLQVYDCGNIKMKYSKR